MAYTFPIDTEHNIYPNLTVRKRLNESNVQIGWSVISNNGYVMYDTTQNDFIIDEETGEEVPVTYYFTEVGLPANYNFDNFSFVAVLRSEVDENYIYGSDEETEVM